VAAPLGRQLSLLRRQSSFRLLFLATFGSGIGTWMATIALTADIAARTDSPWWVSGLLIVTFLPGVAVGLLAGPLIDRLSRKKLIIASDLVRLAVFALLPFVHQPAGILALATAAGVANSFFRPAVLAGVPNLLAEEDVAHGTSLLQVVEWTSAAVGPILGGAVVSAANANAVYWINAGTFLFSALLLLRIPARLLQAEQALTQGHWRDLRDGVAVFRRSPALRTALFAFGFAMLATGLNNVAEFFLANHSLHRGAFGYGLLWTATGIGLVAGGLVSGSLLEDRDVRAVYPVVFLPWALGLLGAGIAPTIWVAAAAMVLSGFGNGLTFPMTVVLVQRFTPDALRGRAFSLIISAHYSLLGVAMVGAGALTGAVGPRWVYALAAALLGLGSLTAAALSRGVQRHPAVVHESAA